MSTYNLTIKIAPAGTQYGTSPPSSFGHMWYEVTNENGVINSYGFAPDANNHGKPFAPGKVYDNDNTQYSGEIFSKNIAITKAQYDTLVAFGDAPQSYGFSTYYNSLTNSCIDFTWKAMSLIGVSPYSSWFDGYLLPVQNKIAVMHADNSAALQTNNEAIKFLEDWLENEGDLFRGFYDHEFLHQNHDRYVLLADAFNQASGLIDPLVIDLDHDGITTINVDASPVQFDLDNNGVAETVGWIEPEDGFIAHDWNGNGVINNRSELFSTFGELGRHDTNGDVIVNASDAAATINVDLDGDGDDEVVTVGWDSLRMWIDANTDGITDAGELVSLAAAGIAEINLDYTETEIENNGNLVNAIADIAMADGTTRATLTASH